MLVTVVKNEISATSDKLVSKLQREIQYLKSLLSLRRKGGIESVERELHSLREENAHLRELSTHLSLEEVHQLRQENKQLKLQLQHLSRDFPHNSSALGFEDPGNRGESQPSSTLEVMSTPDYRQNLTENKQFEGDFYDLLSRKETDIKQTLAEIRKKELKIAGLNLQQKAVSEGRCPVCTLKVPCNHYRTQSDLPARSSFAAPQFEDKSVILNISGIGDLTTDRIESLSVRHSRFPGLVGKKETHRRALSYRYRGNSSSNAVPGKLLELQEAKQRKKALKAAEQKLSLLEKLERYREAKLKAEVEKLEEEKKLEEMENRKNKEKEEKRQKYLIQQKEKLMIYETKRREKEAKEREFAVLEERKRRKSEVRAAREREAKKRLIEEYKKKKRLIEGLESDQVQDLGET